MEILLWPRTVTTPPSERNRNLRACCAGPFPPNQNISGSANCAGTQLPVRYGSHHRLPPLGGARRGVGAPPRPAIGGLELAQGPRQVDRGAPDRRRRAHMRAAQGCAAAATRIARGSGLGAKAHFTG